MDDQEIIELYWARDQRAVTETNAKYGGYCYTIAYNILEIREDAEEQVNDTWMQAWSTIPPNRPQYLPAYLGTITRNLSIARYRRDRAEKRGHGQVAMALHELQECIPDGKSTEQNLLAKELYAEMETFLNTVRASDRAVFIARYWGLSPVREIARRYGYSVGGVKSSLHRTRKKLKRYLEERGYTP